MHHCRHPDAPRWTSNVVRTQWTTPRCLAQSHVKKGIQFLPVFAAFALKSIQMHHCRHQNALKCTIHRSSGQWTTPGPHVPSMWKKQMKVDDPPLRGKRGKSVDAPRTRKKTPLNHRKPPKEQADESEDTGLRRGHSWSPTASRTQGQQVEAKANGKQKKGKLTFSQSLPKAQNHPC